MANAARTPASTSTGVKSNSPLNALDAEDGLDADVLAELEVRDGPARISEADLRSVSIIEFDSDGEGGVAVRSLRDRSGGALNLASLAIFTRSSFRPSSIFAIDLLSSGSAFFAASVAPFMAFSIADLLPAGLPAIS